MLLLLLCLPMGCSNGHYLRRISTVPADARAPFSRSQVRQIKAFWSNVKRRFEVTARENLIRFFRHNPHFQDMYPELRELKDEQDMHHSQIFEIQAMHIFTVYDDVIENLDKDQESIIYRLEEVARMHAKLPGFQGYFFNFMEEPLIESFREKLWEEFTERDEQLFRRLFHWMQQIMSSEAEAIEYSR